MYIKGETLITFSSHSNSTRMRTWTFLFFLAAVIFRSECINVTFRYKIYTRYSIDIE